MKPENRARWKADEAAYLAGWPLTDDRKDALHARDYNRLLHPGRTLMARITAGIATSRIPAVGAALDNGRTAEPYRAPVFAGYDGAKEFQRSERPDVIVLAYNDHASAFDVRIIPTFAIGCADTFAIADEGGDRAPSRRSRGMPTLPGTSRRAVSSTSST